MNAAIKFMTLIALALSVSAHAEAAKRKHAKVAPKKAKLLQPVGSGKRISFTDDGQGNGKVISQKSNNLSTDVVFDGSLVNGKYHTAGEAVTTVETEKKMNELVGFRRDFKDRLALERAKLNAGQ